MALVLRLAKECPQVHLSQQEVIVNNIKTLQSLASISDFANFIGIEPKSLTYIAYFLPLNSKYTSFQIPKKNGGIRKIDMPMGSLSIIQKKYLLFCKILWMKFMKLAVLKILL